MPHNHTVSCVFKFPAPDTPHSTSRQWIFPCAISTGTHAFSSHMDAAHNCTITVAAISHAFIKSSPSHHPPSQQLPPIPSPSASIPQPHLRQYYHPQLMFAGQYAVPPYQHSLGPAPPLQPSVPVMTPHIWAPQAPHPSYHDQFRRQYQTANMKCVFFM